MDKTPNFRWKKVCTRKPTHTLPIPRWGHTSCTIQDQIVVFGGYADTNYMNDMWVFNASTMEWREVLTTGEVPQNRSNCTMNYDSANNRIIIFGGGGSSKKRFNTISILDWDTKVWTEIKPTDQKNAPWERTYHSAELHYPYLIIYGGEGIADLDDLWVFNFETSTWKQVIVDKKKPRPCARRFHSSALVGKEMFIIAGCHSRYRSLNDVYSLDLTPLIERDDYEALQWKERKLDGATFLTRWGHTSTVLDDKIYVFGGRFSNDLNDLLLIDLNANAIKTVKGTLDAPNARRRHCASFLGSCLIVFGGFNGEYFNDMHYINLLQTKTSINKLQILSKYSALLKQQNSKYLPNEIKVCDGTIRVNTALWLPALGYDATKIANLIEILETHTVSKAIQLLKYLYSGVGELQRAVIETKKFKLDSFQGTEARNYYNTVQNRLKGNDFETTILSLPGDSSGVMKFKESEWLTALTKHDSSPYYDIIVVSDKVAVKSNRIIISLMSDYMNSLINGGFQQNSDMIQLDPLSQRVFRVFMKYLEYDLVLIPETFSKNEWTELAAAAKYYCLDRLVSICEWQISLLVSTNYLADIFKFAIINDLDKLSNFCAEQIVKKEAISISLIHRKESMNSVVKPDKPAEIVYNHYQQIQSEDPVEDRMIKNKNRCYKMLYFELQQSRLELFEVARVVKPAAGEKSLSRLDSEKENSEINS